MEIIETKKKNKSVKRHINLVILHQLFLILILLTGV